MENSTYTTLDGNEAAARIAFILNELIAIYPITPASPMAEWADTWTEANRKNLWGVIPLVIEMQSEGGVAGAVHGALQMGALTTTFTASQGLLLMIPNLFKIAGELTSTVFHIAARSVAAQALSIFGDHSDVMAARGTGFAMLSASSVQEAQDFAAIATAATLESRIPFLHFFDGFRTSHEIQKVELLSIATLRELIQDKSIMAHRARALSPDHPVIRGTAQNPDVFFQARETVNPYYLACSKVTQKVMNDFVQLTGRQYQLFEYHGHPEADRIIALMGSGCETVHETVDALNRQGAQVGVIKVRLYRPWDAQQFISALPPTTQAIAILDRTKEPGSIGEPLYLDVLATLHEQSSHHSVQKVVGGRYGLSSKEFTPAMVKGIFDNLATHTPKNHFTIGIHDDVTLTSLPYDSTFSIESDQGMRAIFYGLGSDGTVGANKNSIKIIGEHTDNYAQGYFVYDSKKSGSVTVSHLRIGPDPIRATYLIEQANFIACHQWDFLDKIDVLKAAQPEAIVLLNSPYPATEIWEHLPVLVQQQVLQKNLQLYSINANQIAQAIGMGGRINTVMQVCFFVLSSILPRDVGVTCIKQAIHQTYGKKGEEIVSMNLKAVDAALEQLYRVPIGDGIDQTKVSGQSTTLPETAPKFVRDVLNCMIQRQGDMLPVSALPADGTYPTGTAKWEKRNIAQFIPVWDPEVCIQCGKCVMVCPHSAIRSSVFDPEHLDQAPPTFKSTAARDHTWSDLKFSIQVAPEDCTGCGICVDVCPAKNKSIPRLKALNMEPQRSLREPERQNWEYFLNLPHPQRQSLNLHKISHQQMQEPLFEFSGACAGCGETPYIKLVTQLFGDRMVVANATGCSSIYGGNLPTTPWTVNADGRGPAWSNSLFEDNAEFGLGFRVAIDQQNELARKLLQEVVNTVEDEHDYIQFLAERLLAAKQDDEADIAEIRQEVVLLKQWLTEQEIHLESHTNERRDNSLIEKMSQLKALADYFVKKSVWIIGGDGWAYDIGYGGLDHVLASGRNVNILVLDTEVYSNTGGQMSKSTPRAAVAKFAAGGKPTPKKDLGLMAMTYGNVYVASVAMGARDEHTLKAFIEAESYEGPSVILAYSHCIAHGIEMSSAMHHQKSLVDAGRWLLYRHDPRRVTQDQNPLVLDSHAPKVPINPSMYAENRFKMLTRSQPETAQQLLQEAQQDVNTRWLLYQYLAARPQRSQS
ncbi:pyruvate:ferredoxin (flavodoxin) oxidoreductase [Acaryochloris marina]|uniref:pyruvate:ferredoxin (flavodoxin) oxidoreductase n=1 Tax=Acaryochloris marina TaxID=155978 RepID=UPI001BAF3D11|nr:pyruvate:ferredoxin (flavodoxin) oxidoreductase [Acaryochloris marina]QUY46028.1 pyruvate:ferredoxin (flavodoxin) oxidoreductase [Acaryochloris marina S15]